jgi:hypothetical protein
MEFNTLGYESQTLVLGGFGCHSLRSKHTGCLIQMEIQHTKVLGVGYWVLGGFGSHSFRSKHMGLGYKMEFNTPRGLIRNLGNWWIRFSYMYDPIKNRYRTSSICGFHPCTTGFRKWCGSRYI